MNMRTHHTLRQGQLQNKWTYGTSRTNDEYPHNVTPKIFTNFATITTTALPTSCFVRGVRITSHISVETIVANLMIPTQHSKVDDFRYSTHHRQDISAQPNVILPYLPTEPLLIQHFDDSSNSATSNEPISFET